MKRGYYDPHMPLTTLVVCWGGEGGEEGGLVRLVNFQMPSPLVSMATATGQQSRRSAGGCCLGRQPLLWLLRHRWLPVAKYGSCAPRIAMCRVRVRHLQCPRHGCRRSFLTSLTSFASGTRSRIRRLRLKFTSKYLLFNSLP